MLAGFRARTATTTVAREVQVSMNGWTSQMIAVNGNPAGVTDADLSAYFDNRRVKHEAPIRADFAANVRAGKKLRAFHDPGRNFWNLSLDTQDLPWNESAWRRKAATWQNAIHAGGEVIRAGTASTILGTQAGVLSAGALVACWENPLTREQLATGALSRAVRERCTDPHAWFLRELGACGIDTTSLFFKGYIDAQESPAVLAGSWTGGPAWRSRLNVPGYTTILGPFDLFGKAPLWISPKLRSTNCLYVEIDPRPPAGRTTYTRLQSGLVDFARDWVLANSTALRCQVIVGSNGDADEIGDKLAGGTIQAGINDLWQDIEGSPNRRVNWGIDARAASLPLMLTSSSTTPLSGMRAFSDSFGALVAGASGIGTGIVDLAWYLVVPKGFDLLHLYNVTSADTTDVTRIVLKPQEVHVGLPMSVVHQKMVADRDSTSDASVKAQYDSAIKGLTPYLDAKARLCVVAEGLPFPRTVDYEALELRKMASEADQDLDKVVIDSKTGLTMAGLAAKLEKRRVAGERWLMASKIYDEALSAVDLTSAGLWAELEVTDGLHTTTRTGIVGEVTYTVRFTSGATIVTDMIGYMIALCYKSDHAAADAELAAMGYDAATTRLELSKLTGAGAGSVFGFGQRGGQPPSTLAFSQASFCDARGVPIMRWNSDDAYVRAAMLFNMGGEKVDGILASTFFCNTIDLT